VKVIVVLGIVALVLMALVPPWTTTTTFSRHNAVKVRDAGYHPIFSPPTTTSYYSTAVGEVASIDFNRLGVQYLAVIIAMCGAVIVSRMGKKDARRMTEEVERPVVPPPVPDRKPEAATPESLVTSRRGSPASDDPKRHRRYTIAGVALTPVIWFAGMFASRLAAEDWASNDDMQLILLGVSLAAKALLSCVAILLISLGKRRHPAWSLLSLGAPFVNFHLLPILTCAFALFAPRTSEALPRGTLTASTTKPEPTKTTIPTTTRRSTPGAEMASTKPRLSNITQRAVAIIFVTTVAIYMGFTAVSVVSKLRDGIPDTPKHSTKATFSPTMEGFLSGQTVVLHSERRSWVHAHQSAEDYRRFSRALLEDPNLALEIHSRAKRVPNDTTALVVNSNHTYGADVELNDRSSGSLRTWFVANSDIWRLGDPALSGPLPTGSTAKAEGPHTAERAGSTLNAVHRTSTPLVVRRPPVVSGARQPTIRPTTSVPSVIPKPTHQTWVAAVIRGEYWDSPEIGLMWHARPAGPFSYPDAVYFCDHSSVGGHSDWQIPDRDQLQQMFTATPGDTAIRQIDDAWSSSLAQRGRLVIGPGAQNSQGKILQEHYYSYAICVRVTDQ